MDSGLPEKPAGFGNIDIAIVLGSGLGDFADALSDRIEISYYDIPAFPEVTVEGHGGSLYLGRLENKTVMVFSGRFHYYEGYPLKRAVLTAHLAKKWGAPVFLATNAAGGLHPDFEPGDLMMLTGWIAPMGPYNMGSLIGRRMVEAGDDRLMILGKTLKTGLHKGCYCFLTGPAYETRAEIRALRFLGADAVGMSTVPELLEAERLGMCTVGISLITNKAAGLGNQKLDHSEVKETAFLAKDRFSSLIRAYIAGL